MLVESLNQGDSGPAFSVGPLLPPSSGPPSSLEPAAAALQGLPSTTVPDPIPATEADIERWISESFSPLSTRSSLPPTIGSEVLWKGFKTGKKGGASTKTEWFNGTVHAIENNNDEGTYFIVS